jgi:serine protease DegQ
MRTDGGTPPISAVIEHCSAATTAGPGPVAAQADDRWGSVDDALVAIGADGRIAWVGARAEAPRFAAAQPGGPQRIDAGGGWLTPGLIDCLYSRTGGSLGIGFAIPTSTARQVMEQIVRHGSVIRGYIGVEPQDVTPELARAFKLPRQDGAIIAGVMRGGPADKAGVKPGDILVDVEGQAIPNTTTMLNVIAQMAPGTTGRFTFLREGREVALPITVGQRPRPSPRRE